VKTYLERASNGKYQQIGESSQGTVTATTWLQYTRKTDDALDISSVAVVPHHTKEIALEIEERTPLGILVQAHDCNSETPEGQ
jgi:hypothetical protein